MVRAAPVARSIPAQIQRAAAAVFGASEPPAWTTLPPDDATSPRSSPATPGAAADTVAPVAGATPAGTAPPPAPRPPHTGAIAVENVVRSVPTAAHRAGPPARTPAASSAAVPDVHITIGRVEIRAAPPASAAPASRAARRAAPSLQDHLRRREGRGE
jgi:hypothetical protein